MLYGEEDESALAPWAGAGGGTFWDAARSGDGLAFEGAAARRVEGGALPDAPDSLFIVHRQAARNDQVSARPRAPQEQMPPVTVEQFHPQEQFHRENSISAPTTAFQPRQQQFGPDVSLRICNRRPGGEPGRCKGAEVARGAGASMAQMALRGRQIPIKGKKNATRVALGGVLPPPPPRLLLPLPMSLLYATSRHLSPPPPRPCPCRCPLCGHAPPSRAAPGEPPAPRAFEPKARDLKARNLKARDLKARNLTARNLTNKQVFESEGTDAEGLSPFAVSFARRVRAAAAPDGHVDAPARVSSMHDEAPPPPRPDKRDK